MDPEQAQLPPLSAADEALLSLAILLNEDLPALSAKTGTPLLTLYRWHSRPDIAAYIADHRAKLAHSRRERAIESLESLAATTDDPIERRRLITLILRALNSRPSRTTHRDPADTPKSDPKPHPTAATSPPSPNPTRDLITTILQEWGLASGLSINELDAHLDAELDDDAEDDESDDDEPDTSDESDDNDIDDQGADLPHHPNTRSARSNGDQTPPRRSDSS